jgi:glycerol uptake facilitator protein
MGAYIARCPVTVREVAHVQDQLQDRGPAAYVAEFVGTMLLVFFVVCVVSGFVVEASAQNPNPFIDWSVIGLAHFFVLFVLIQTLAVASGAHFNPAVTAALTLMRQIKPPDAAIYVVAQLAGAVAGALIAKLLLTEFSNAEAVNYGATLVNETRLGGKIGLGMLGEFIGTFFLLWAIIGVAVNPRAAKDWAALAIGAALGLGVMVLGPFTGASFNPARSFGPALVSGEWGGAGDFLLVYVLAPVLGALAAAVLYGFVIMAPGAKGPSEMEPVG